MVLTPALVVPDEQTWTMSGTDPAALGIEPVFDPVSARRVLRLEGAPEIPEISPPHDHGGHEHGGHDMMAIVGEPSADGLVMESIDFRFGPAGTPLPAGLVVDVTLDGDVVARCEVRALLTGSSDALAPRAWERAMTGGGDWRLLALAEVERAVSHTAWLRAFGRVLGWPVLVERAGAALTPTLAAASLRRDSLGAAAAALADLARFVERSRRLRWRTRGLGRVTGEVTGPAARARGVAEDARSADPLYRRLGFEPVVRTEGDAWARTVVRADEAVAAVELAARAMTQTDLPPQPGRPVVEGPRGPLPADGERPEAPGERAALAAAAESAVGAEWAAALTAIASFDLTPWRVAR